MAIDLHYGRQVRHLDRLLDHSRLAEQPGRRCPRPDMRAWRPPIRRPRPGAAQPGGPGQRPQPRAGRAARAPDRAHEPLLRRPPRRAGRTGSGGRATRTRPPARAESRREALDREEQVRVAELRQKSTLQVHLRLLQLLVIHQPKLVATRPGERPRPHPGPPGNGLGPAPGRSGSDSLSRVRPAHLRPGPDPPGAAFCAWHAPPGRRPRDAKGRGEGVQIPMLARASSRRPGQAAVNGAWASAPRMAWLEAVAGRRQPSRVVPVVNRLDEVGGAVGQVGDLRGGDGGGPQGVAEFVHESGQACWASGPRGGDSRSSRAMACRLAGTPDGSG